VQEENESDIDMIELREDCEKALAVLGIQAKNIYFGNFPDNEMDKHSLLELIHWLEEIISKVKPDLILTHHRYCTNIDHQYCHEAVVIATRPGLQDHVTVLCGEVPSSTGYLKPVQWEPNCYIEVSDRNLEAKVKAMESYKGEDRPDPHPRSQKVLSALAKVRGSESGYYFAESFMIYKIFG
jgi:LmbE family N-acetylglucosaminyl deacetylase